MVLTLTFLGVGSAFAKRSFHSNALIEAWTDGPSRQDKPDCTLLIDFGATGPTALHQLKSKPGFAYLNVGGVINYPAIQRVLVTHLHSDHIGGLEEMAGMRRHFFGRDLSGAGVKPTLIGTPEVLTDLWAHSLSGGLSATGGALLALEDYFEVQPVQPYGTEHPDRISLLDRFEFALIPTDHLYVSRRFDWPSYAVLMTDTAQDATAVLSGDTRFDGETLARLMADARVSFHDVQLEDTPNPVHALLSELRTLPEHTRKKTFLYHYGDNWDDPRYDFVAREFAGFAQPQQRYVIFED